MKNFTPNETYQKMKDRFFMENMASEINLLEMILVMRKRNPKGQDV